MLDLRFYNILKANGWQPKEINDFANYYDEFLKDNEPDFTLFMNYLHEKGFNKTTSELIKIYTTYKKAMQTKVNTNNQAPIQEDEQTKEEPEQIQDEEDIEVEPVLTDEMKKDLKSVKNSLRRFKKHIELKEAELKAETDPANKEALKSEINEYKKHVKQLFTERMNGLKTKHGSIEAFQRKIVDFDKFYVPENQSLNNGYRNFQYIATLKDINDFKDARTTKWKEEHKKGFILTKLSPKLDVVKIEKPDLFNNLARVANAVKQAALEKGVNIEEYQTLARQYMDTQKETLGRMKNWKINRDLGKEYILKSGNHIEIPEWLLNMTISKTK